MITAKERDQFIAVNTYSPRNVALVEEAIAARNKQQLDDPCYCSPDSGTVKTYQGWKDSGRHVVKGQKALCRVVAFVYRGYEKDGKTVFRKTPWTAAVFCLCQTETTVN
tara:strand:- start:451 stop:777 length:327 start_codon:yes stop_codon:yes gene_type:complete